MTLAASKRGGGVFAAAAEPSLSASRASIRATGQRRDWQPEFERAHGRAVMALLAALIVVGAGTPAMLTSQVAGAVLLIGGALIGIPHGSSDFVVAHRLLAPRLLTWWLPAFLAVYLGVTAMVLLGWYFAPETTFVAFLVVSGLHFGACRTDPVCSADSALRYLARATTPVVPIFLFHPGEVAGIIGLMCGRPTTSIVTILEFLRPTGLVLYFALLGCLIFQAFRPTRPAPRRSAETLELVLLAAAAFLLPPLLVFAVYFCLLHAVRHMAELGHDTYPSNGRAALWLAAAIVIPSALVCLVVLGCNWDTIAGALNTETILAAALQITASLTIPHVILEGWADWRDGPS